MNALPVSSATDPWTLIVPAAAVIIVGVLGFWNARFVAGKAGASVQSTIDADRRARVLERRLTLYGDILTFAARRRQNRDKVLSHIVINGVEILDAYDPLDVFALEGQSRAIADLAVLEAFSNSNDASQNVMNRWMAGKVAPMPGNAVRDLEELERLREIANSTDELLKEAIRRALHQ
jgi:hypothetical protein